MQTVLHSFIPPFVKKGTELPKNVPSKEGYKKVNKMRRDVVEGKKGKIN